MATYTKKYSGSAWVEAPFKRYNGSAWVDATVNKWDGSKWVQLYPETAVSKTETITGGTTLWTYRKGTYNNWKQEDAKQGNGSSYGGDSHNFGYLNLSSAKFPGHGSINSVSSAKYTGTRGGAGTYNQNQTIKFYRSNVAPTSSTSATPSGTCSGLFTASTGGPGSGGTMSNRTISSLDNCLSWMNGVDGKKQLLIASSTADDYLSITGASKVTATYVYMAKMAVFTDADAKMISNIQLLSNLSESETYHKMIITPDEENMTLREIFEHREQNNLSDITTNDILTDYVKKIMLKGSTLTKDGIQVQLDYLTENHIPEFSMDGERFYPMTSPKVDTYEGILDPDFDKYRNNIYVRVRNKATDSIDFEFIKEPALIL